MLPTVRDYRPSDLETLYELDQLCFEPGIAYSRAEIAGYIRRPGTKTCIAETRAEDHPALAGFVIAHCDRSRRGHIITLDVAPRWRRRGIGNLLMDAAEHWMRRQSMEIAALETAEDNLRAQTFYSQRGYAKVRRIEDYYGEGAPAWLMTKPLRA